MKYSNPLCFLVGAVAAGLFRSRSCRASTWMVFAVLLIAFLAGGVARATPEADARARVALALASARPAPEPARPVSVKGNRDPSCPCPCGCGTSGVCVCTSAKKAKKAAFGPWKTFGIELDGKIVWYISNRSYPTAGDSEQYPTWEAAKAEADKRNGVAAKAADELSRPYAKAWLARGWVYHPEEGGYWTRGGSAPAPTSQAAPVQFAPFRSYGSCGAGGCASGSCGQSFAPFRGFSGGGCASGSCGGGR